MAAIAVVGATGRTGRVIIDRALARGHRVTAIVRSAGSFAPAPGLTEIVADPTAPGSLAGRLGEQDAVISALGAVGRGPTTVYSAGTTEIISAMGSGGRLLVISSAGLAVPAAAGTVTKVFAAALHRIMRHTYADMATMERLLADSDLRWTPVRPTRLTDDPATGNPRISLGATAQVGPRTSRTDLATYLLDAIDDPRTEHTAVAISS
ncbi:NAD(P)H-binding protein [Nocardia sp. SYP-A9097]|uniref:NAD(P)-dependent oxidoreductase n=1 Tax=Nocardia sp. SYP-A9097 TaxID=2663237 RepID=UPI00129B65A2|nr:NAD(P)H-binding protein [Nocardia sp. SYP-A9097]MRH87897.1 NAD(P)H-binding protein [Nocardia sp. SYP-A9097]